MNHDEDMLKLTLAIPPSNASPEASGSDTSGGSRFKAEDDTRNLDSLEARFQSHFSTDEFLAMTKDGSYQPKLDEYRRTGQVRREVRVGSEWVTCTQTTLPFKKELTPSDVGRLNALVIPKKWAASLFPNVNDNEKLEFVDKTTKRWWSFWYAHWKSNFVLTKGWSKFVKEKGLKTKDVVIVYKCQISPAAPSFYVINVKQSQPQLEGIGVGPSAVAEAEEGEVDDEGQEEKNVEVEEERRVIKLFGVDIQSHDM